MSAAILAAVIVTIIVLFLSMGGGSDKADATPEPTTTYTTTPNVPDEVNWRYIETGCDHGNRVYLWREEMVVVPGDPTCPLGEP